MRPISEMGDYSYLNELEAKSIYVIREAYWRYRDRLGVLWSMGKDSTTMVHLIRKAFFGTVPIPIIHIDTTFKFKEIYRFRDRYAKKWNLRPIIAKNEKALREGMSPKMGRFNCCDALKTEALKLAIKEYGFRALLLAIRSDEHGIRAKERIFSPRDQSFQWNYLDQPPELWDQYETKAKNEEHLRIHPLLRWREIDVWEYIRRENIPIVSLYFAKGGKRYRSIGCQCCCNPIDSNADTIDKIIEELKTSKVSERSGRAQDKENAYAMQRLRSLGYM